MSILSILYKIAAGSVIADLLEAKRKSDARQYTAKHIKIRELISKHPNDFFIDSVLGNIAGITHRKSNFKLHVPINVLPDSLRLANVNSLSDVGTSS